MARAEPVEEEFDVLALELFRLQFENVPIYRKLCLSRKKTPGKILHWSEIPTLPTEAFKEYDVTSLAPEERTNVFYSSGTTAADRSRHFHSAESIGIYEDSLRPWFRRHFLPDQIEMNLLILTPSKETAPNSSLAHMFDTVARSFPWVGAETVGRVVKDGGWELDLERASGILRVARAPVALLGTAFSLVHLLDALNGEKVRLPAGSRAMETGGYKWLSRIMPKTELHQLIKSRLGIPLGYIVSEYGMSELSTQAYDRVAGKAGGIFHFPHWARTEVVSSETGRPVSDGESGILRVFDLANIWSVMALQTGDVAIRRGKGFELVGRAETAVVKGCSMMAV